jgi:hypothetical protein
MPRPRFRFRTVMVLVAVVALALGGYVEVQRRRQKFEKLAAYHEARIGQGGFGNSRSLTMMNRAGQVIGKLSYEVSQSEHRRWWDADQAWHKEMKAKYLGAASRPWLPVAPDPPQPKLDLGGPYFAPEGAGDGLVTGRPPYEDQPPLDVYAVPRPAGAEKPVGKAALGSVLNGVVCFRLTVGGRTLPGLFVCNRGRFLQFEEWLRSNL